MSVKPYYDESCPCHELERAINAEFPERKWNFGDSCSAWNERSGSLEDNDIEFEDWDDACHACTCPTCGRTVCGWCI